MKHIVISILLIGITALLLGSLLYFKKINIELFSALIVIVLAISGYIYQSGENRKMQNLQYKRETYANLMQEIAIFKRSGIKSDEEKKNYERMYWRSWAETSDEVNEKLLIYLDVYQKWTADKTPENAKIEEDAFDDLVNQIKKEISPGSKATFKAYYFP